MSQPQLSTTEWRTVKRALTIYSQAMPTKMVYFVPDSTEEDCKEMAQDVARAKKIMSWDLALFNEDNFESSTKDLS